MPTLPSTLPKEAVEFARKYGILSPERNGIIREGLQATADAATGVVEGFAKSAEQAGIPSRKLTNWISDIRARNQQWNPYPGYRMGNLTDLPGLARTAATGITQSAGFLGAGAAATVAGGPLAGAAATTGVAFAQIYGREVEEFQSQMEDQELAKTLATFSALGQAAIEAVLGPEAIVRGIAKNIATGALRQTTRKLGQSVVMKAVTGGVGEGLEEFFQKYISDLAKRMGGVEVPQAPLREWWDTFAGGAIPGAILGGGGQVVENSLAAITAKPVAAQRGDLSGLEFDTGLVSRINAEREQAGQAPLAENSYAIDTEMDDQRQAAERIAEALGIQVQFVRPTNPDAAYWNGRKDGDTLYLARAENLNPVQQTLGHEFAHYMHQVTPRLAREFSDYLQTVAEDFPAYAEKLAALRKKWLNADTTSDALAAEEFMADVMGEMFLDTGFWEIVGSRDQTIAQKVMQYVIRFLDTMRQKLTGSEDVRAQIEKQIDGVRQMAAQTVAGYQAERQARAETVEAGPDAQGQTVEVEADAQDPAAEPRTEAERWMRMTGAGMPDTERTPAQKAAEKQIRDEARRAGVKADDGIENVIGRLTAPGARSGPRFSLAGEEDTPVGAATRVPPPQTAAPNYSRDQADYVALSGMTPQDAVYYSINEKPVGDRKLMTMIANQLDPTRKGWSKHTAETKRQAKQVLDDLFSNTPGMNEFIEATLALKEFYPEMSTKAFPKNSDPTYAITIDSVGACVRMMRAFPVDKYIRQELGKKLTSAQRQAVRAELNKAGHALQCIYCYAFTRRANAQAKTEAMINGLRSGQPVALEAAAAEKRESLEKLWKAAIKEARKNPSWEEDLRALPDIFQIKSASVEALEVASVDAAAWARQYPAIFALRQKITDPGNMRLPGIDTAVAGQIATLPKKMISALKRWGGLRWQSSIDFVPAFAYDYVMGIFEMAMGKIPGHVYTKEIDLVRLWGDNGMKINLSAAPRVRNGKAVWDRKRNMPMIDPSIGSMLAEEIDEAMRLAPDHAGVMMLVPSDDVFEWLVTSESKYAHYGIPFHASGMPTFVAEAFYDTKTRTGSPIGAKDYTDPHETVRAYPTVEDMPEALRPLAVPLVDKAGEDTGFLVVAYEKIGTVYPELAWVGKWYDQERKAHVNSGTKANPVHPDSRPTSLNLPTGDIIDQETGVSDAEATRLYFDLLDRLDLGPQFEESFLKGYMERHGGTRPPYYWRIKKHYARTDTPFAPPDPGKMNFKHGEKLNQTFIQSPMGKAIKASMAMGQNMPVIDSYRHRELSAKEKAEIDRAVEKVLAAENPVRSVYEEGTPSYSLSDADYLAAVEAGDMATAQRMVNRAAKAAGYTVGPVWHGTPAEFTTFVERSRPKRDEMFSFGFHFTDAPELSAEYGPRQVNAYLKAESPLDTEQVVYRDSDLGQWLSKIAPRTRWFPSDGREAVYLRNALDAMPGRRAKQAVMDAGYDAILYKATLANNNPMGFREVGATGDATIVFAPSQIKSADPVTYDDAGNVIPLSERFNPESDDIRYSLADRDADYLAAVEAGDMATAQRLVGEAARATGYTVGPVYHGTPDGRFLQSDPVFKSPEQRYGISHRPGVHWFAADRRTAATYADDRRAFDYQNAEPAVVGAYLRIANPLEVDGAGRQWRQAQSAGRTATVIEQAMEGGHDGVVINNVQDDYQTGSVGASVPTTTYAVFASDQIKSADPVTYDDAGNVIPLSKRFDPANEDIRYSLADRDAPYLKAVEAGDMDTAQKLVDEAAKAAGYTTEAYRGSPNANLGTYPGSDGAMIFVAKDKELAAIYGEPRRVYVRTGKAFDASRGEDYEAFRRFESERGISATGGGRGGFKGTSIAPHWTAEYDLRQFLDREGIEYDALYIGENTGESSLALREINQIKSAEPVTYDDSGRVIPLSERFNPQSDDIRYSLATRPLANPATRPGPRATVDYVDQLRAAEGLPGRQTVAEWQAEADSLVEQDGDRLWEDLAAGRLNMDDPVNTMVAKRLIDERASIDLDSLTNPALRTVIAAVKAYRAGRSQIARAMRAGFDPVRPADPNSVYRQVMGLIRAAVLDPGKLDEVDIETIRKRLVKLKAALRKKGIDLDNLTPEDVARPEDRAKIVREVQTAKAGFGDMAYEWWINGLLSLPTTHASNILGNTAYAVSDLTLQRAVEATLNLVARKKNAATWGEFRSMAEAFRGNLRTAFRNAAQAWETERPVTGTSQKLEGPVKAAIPGTFGRIVRGPGRALLWADEVAKSLIVPIEAAAFAHRQAKAEGLTGAALEARVRELAGNRDGDAVAYAQNRALEMTFQARPGQIVSHLLNIRENGGVAGALVKYTLPFLTTPTNILKTTVRKSPLGTLSFTGRLATGGYKGQANRAIRDAAEQILAWGVVGTIASLYDDDDEPVITGARPRYGTGEYAAEQRGIPAQSIRIGDRWYSYARLEPFAGILTMIVDSLEAMRMAKNGAEGEKIVRHLVNSAKQNVRDKTFLKTVGDIVRASEDPKSAGRLASSFVASWVPNAIRGTVQRLEQTLPDRTNYSRGLEYWKDQFSTQIALDAGLVRAEPKVDVWGRDVERGERLGYTTDVIWRLMSPVYTKVPQDNPLDELLYTWNRENPNDSYWPGMPLPRVVVRGKTLWMKGGEYRRFAKDAGKLARERLERMVRSGKLNPRAPTEEDIKVIKSEIAKARATARKRLLSRMGL